MNPSVADLRTAYEKLKRNNNLDDWPIEEGEYMQIEKCRANLMQKIRQMQTVSPDVCIFLDMLYKVKMNDLATKMNTDMSDHSRNIALLQLSGEVKFLSQLEKERQKRLDAENQLATLRQKFADGVNADNLSHEAADESIVEALKAEIDRLQSELQLCREKKVSQPVEIFEPRMTFCNDAISRARDELAQLKDEYERLGHTSLRETSSEVFALQAEADEKQKREMELLYEHAKSFILGTLDVISEVTNNTSVTKEKVAQYMIEGKPEQYFDALRQALSEK